jgi:hypothetical protein
MAKPRKKPTTQQPTTTIGGVSPPPRTIIDDLLPRAAFMKRYGDRFSTSQLDWLLRQRGSNGLGAAGATKKNRQDGVYPRAAVRGVARATGWLALCPRNDTRCGWVLVCTWRETDGGAGRV